MEKIKNPLFTENYTYVVGGNKSDKNVTALHDFEVRRKSDDKPLAEIHFQQGPIKEVGVEGINNEDVLLMVLTRLQGFQQTKFACRENAMAITKLEEAVMWLRKRTLDRDGRGVLGTHEV